MFADGDSSSRADAKMDRTQNEQKRETADLFGGAARAEGREPLTVFHVELLSREQTNWRELFQGFDHLRAITYSSGLEAILQLAEMFSDVEITFGSERILSREHAALEQVTQVAEGYTFVDAVADQKAFIETLAEYLGKSARGLLPRVMDSTLRFQVLRKMPSHEKLYLLSGADRFRVITGSANLSMAALSGWQKEVYIALGGEKAYREFESFYRRDVGVAAPIKPEYLVEPASNDAPLEPRTAPVPLTEVPCVQVLSSSVTILEERPKLPSNGLTSEALRAATME
jgi:NgoFVII-like restriction endonuclease